MSADIHLIQNTSDLTSGPVPLARSVYLDAYLAPLRPWLERETITEILVNRTGEVWVEDAAMAGMQRIELPEITDELLQRLAEQVARVSHQGINREHPLLAATLPAEGHQAGARIQVALAVGVGVGHRRRGTVLARASRRSSSSGRSRATADTR